MPKREPTKPKITQIQRSLGIAPMSVQKGGIKILLYGQTKTGKTSLWGTFPKKTLAIICSGGNRSGELRTIATKENLKSIDVLEADSSSKIIEAIKYLSENEHGYETVVLDHVTGFQDLMLKEVLDLDEIPVAKTWGLARQQDYGQCTVQCKTILRDLLNLDCDVAIIGQEREFEKKEDSELVSPNVGVALMPGLAGWLYTTVDYICQTFKSQKYETKNIKIGDMTESVQTKIPGVNYCLRVGPHEVYTTGFRIPKERNSELPEYIVDPTYEKLMEFI